MKNLDLETPFIQKQFGYCTVYNHANIFRNCEFIRFTTEEEYKCCDEEKENTMFDKLGYDIRIADVARVNHEYSPLPNDFILKVLMADGKHCISREEAKIEIPIVPYILTVRLIKKYYHSVGVLNCKGKLFYTDPYKPEIIPLKQPEQLFKNFMDCWGIRRPYMKENDAWAVLRGEHLGYEFLLNYI